MSSRKFTLKRGSGSGYHTCCRTDGQTHLDHIRSSIGKIKSITKTPKINIDRRADLLAQQNENNLENSKKSPQGNKDYEKNLVFVAMSFSEEGMDDVFSAIKGTCETFELLAKRVDENISSGIIAVEIYELIEKAEFVIVDLTYERPNVYYELGYAHGVGNSSDNILLIAKNGTPIHFDIAGFRVRFYKSTEDLRKVIKENLTGMIKASRLTE